MTASVTAAFLRVPKATYGARRGPQARPKLLKSFPSGPAARALFAPPDGDESSDAGPRPRTVVYVDRDDPRVGQEEPLDAIA